MISIIVPTLNEEKYLPTLLKSLRNQTRQDFELIGVDSYSDDSTVDLLKEFGARVIYVKRGNIGLARNTGAKAARGSIIVHVSADAYYPPYWLEALVRPIEESRAKATFGSIYVQDANLLERIGGVLLNKIIVPALQFTPLVWCSADNLAFDKAFYERIGGINEHLHTGEDLEVVKRAKKYGKVLYVERARAYTSPRRIRKWHPLKYVLFHTVNFFRVNFTGRGSDEYEPIR